MRKKTSNCCQFYQSVASLILRLVLVITFLPAGFKKILDFSGSVDGIKAASLSVTPAWLAGIMSYFIPFSELYIGIALLLGYGGKATKITTLLVSFSIMFFWFLKKGADFTHLSDAHTWYFVAAIIIALIGFGEYSLDHIIRKRRF